MPRMTTQQTTLLTPAQERFAAALLVAPTASHAWRAAYPDSKAAPRSVAVEASRLRRHPLVAQRFEELCQLRAALLLTDPEPTEETSND